MEGGRRGENEEEMVRFPCGRWLEMCDGCGGQVEAELFPVGVAGSKYTLEVGMLVMLYIKNDLTSGADPGF